MYELKTVAGVSALYKNKKQVKKTDIKSFAEYGIQLIKEGKNFNQIPPESDNVPMLADIIIYIDEHLAEKKSEAENIRLAIVKENLHQCTQDFMRDPSSENEKRIKEIRASYASFLNHANLDTSVVINFHKNVPDGFYDRVEPEHPLTQEEIDKWAKFGQDSV